MPKKGFFLTLEGTDGVGKSTHAQLLSSWLRSKGKKVLLTREPGGGKVAEQLRWLLLNPALDLENLTELFLYEAARVEHLNKVIRPALKRGRFVVCDRFADATVAYQGFARGLMKEVAVLNQIATGGLKPDLTVLLNLPPSIGIKKARARKKKGDRLENEGLKFQMKVQKGYFSILRKEPGRVKRVEVQPSIEQTQNRIRTIVEKRLK